MGHEAPVIAIAKLRTTWDGEVKPSVRRALVAGAFTSVIVAAHTARVGSGIARGIALALLGVVVVALVVRAVIVRRRRSDVRVIVQQTIAKTDEALGAATLRALTLASRAAVDPQVGSPALATLHLSRLIGRASHERILERAALAARTWAGAALAFAMVSLAAVVVEPFRVVEGLDVMAARHGEAPLPLAWLDDIDMTAAPPDYLHETAGYMLPFAETEEPRGSTITVRGRPLRSGRALVLTDGSVDVPFVDDGSDGVVARWTLGDTADLFIAAKFGAVRVRQLDHQRVVSIPDEAPVVTLEGAPRTVKLLNEPSVPVHFEATDDHGLREVNLVLRSGSREERRVLSRPTADARVDRGGVEIKASDPFVKRTFAPIEVTVEARDNDPVSGPKWGKSAAIIVVPPEAGEPEALRYAALLKARDALTDLVADRAGQKAPTTKDKADHIKHEADAQKAAVEAVEDALSGTYGGLRMRGRPVALARGQLRRLAAALDEERKSPTTAKHEALVEASESVLLAFDSAVRGLGVRDSRFVAGKLAEVADELAAAAYAASSGGASAVARLDAATQVLDGGGKQLLRLGDLGLDLGEIVANDLRRVARARQAGDMFHAELAARDLAERLRRPEPSFGGGGRGGVESGGPEAPSSKDASDADDQVQAGEKELEELARDHAIEMNEVSQALDRAVSKEELEALREEAKKHAQAIREAVRSLPQTDTNPGSAESAAAEGRAQAESMAGALEQGQPRDAVQSGKGAMRALGEAKRLGDQSGGFFPEERAGRESAKARETIERELAWAEDALESLRRAASERAKDDLSKSSKSEEMLAERSKRLADKGQSGDRSMPQEMLERLGDAEQAMRRAQKALSEGNGEEGVRHQKDAQRMLEMASGERGEDGSEKASPSEPREGEDGKALARKADIPDKNRHKGPEDFRRRVLEGLGGSQDPVLKEAVKRYAEGLLR